MRPLELTVEGFRSYRKRVDVRLAGPAARRHRRSDRLGEVLDPRRDLVRAVRQDAQRGARHEVADPSAGRPVARRAPVRGGRAGVAVQRALRSNGQAGSKLQLVTQDDGEPDVPEIITGVRTMNERIEQLLGMDFKTFCRSVLLAQNRFSEFLKATAGERDEVLKGVFGYERLDDAQRVAKSRLDRARWTWRPWVTSGAGSTRRERGSRSRARRRVRRAALAGPRGGGARGGAAEEGARRRRGEMPRAPSRSPR